MSEPILPGNVVSLDALRAQVQERTRAEEQELQPRGSGSPGTGRGGPGDPEFVHACLTNNERGDGVLYAALHRGRFLHNKATGLWFKWAGHHWAPDRLNEATAAVDQVALAYLAQADALTSRIRSLGEQQLTHENAASAAGRQTDPAAAATAKDKASSLAQQGDQAARQRQEFTKRVERLRSVRGAANCMAWSHCIEEPLAIIGDEIDRQPMLLPCANGVIDLETGDLRPGDPADLLVRSIPIEYHGIERTNAAWETFMAEIHQGDAELVAFVQRLLGYCLTGLTTEHFIACFLGEGANGKGTLFEVLREVMGELSWAIEPEMLLEQKSAKSSAGPSPDVISLHGRRLVVASETDKNRKISAAKVKRYTGGDTLIGRSPHDKYEINFQPSHKMVLYTNHAPKGLADDFALFRRLVYLVYPLRFVEDVPAQQARDPQNAHLYRPRNVALKAQLLADPGGILAWLVRGCLQWQQLGGLKPPASILAAAEAVRRNEDHLENFLDAQATRVDADYTVRFGWLYEQFAAWYAENVDEDKRYIPTKKSLGDQLRRKGYHLQVVGGQLKVHGLDVHQVAG